MTTSPMNATNSSGSNSKTTNETNMAKRLLVIEENGKGEKHSSEEIKNEQSKGGKEEKHEMSVEENKELLKGGKEEKHSSEGIEEKNGEQHSPHIEAVNDCECGN